MQINIWPGKLDPAFSLGHFTSHYKAWTWWRRSENARIYQLRRGSSVVSNHFHANSTTHLQEHVYPDVTLAKIQDFSWDTIIWKFLTIINLTFIKMYGASWHYLGASSNFLKVPSIINETKSFRTFLIKIKTKDILIVIEKKVYCG